MDWVLVIVWGIIMLSVLVVVHEAGHFLTAKAFGVRVTEFMVGLPGPSIGFTRGGTRYGVTAVPLGGYARIAGMETGEEDPLLADALAYVNRQGSTDVEHLALALDIDETHAETLLVLLSGWGSITTPKGSLTADVYLACPRGDHAKGQAREVADPAADLAEERKGTYHALSVWKRLLCVFAGPLANLLLAIIIFVAIYSGHGVYEPDNVLYQVMDGSPAAAAGLQAGDEITAVDGVQTDTWDEVSTALATYSKGDTVEITYDRDGASATTDVALYSGEDESLALGVYADYKLVHWSLGKATLESFSYIGQVAQAIVDLFMPQTAMQTLSESSSVVGIAYMAKDAADMGALSFVALGAAISISLGLFNLVPIPPLDGGRIIIEIVQGITRREISMRVYNIITAVGIALFMALFVYLLFQDIGRYVIGG